VHDEPGVVDPNSLHDNNFGYAKLFCNNDNVRVEVQKQKQNKGATIHCQSDRNDRDMFIDISLLPKPITIAYLQLVDSTGLTDRRYTRLQTIQTAT
jgi:hypothetical protein